MLLQEVIFVFIKKNFALVRAKALVAFERVTDIELRF